jgi:hypothetical protein
MTELEKKLWKRVKKYLTCLRWVPFLRMVAVCNNLAFGKVDERSDIDLFIVARKGRLFIVRILVTLVLHLLGVRRHGGKVAGRFCLSFFVDDSALGLERIALKDDVYLAYWCRSMKPILDDGVSKDFVLANEWADNFFADIGDKSLKSAKNIGAFSRAKKVWIFVLNGKFGNWIEGFLRCWQLKRAKSKMKKAGDAASLIVDEHILKFHNVDRRKFYRDKWFEKYGKKAQLTESAFLEII